MIMFVRVVYCGLGFGFHAVLGQGLNEICHAIRAEPSQSENMLRVISQTCAGPPGTLSQALLSSVFTECVTQLRHVPFYGAGGPAGTGPRAV
jgi:hypothetical protein